MKRSALLCAVLLLSACGGGTAPAPDETAGEGSAPTTTGVDAIEVEAEDFAFSVGTVTAAAGSQVSIAFRNRDGVPHSMGFYADGDAIFNGDSITGPDAETTYLFQAPAEPGTYTFQCDVHPDQMTGTFEVS